MKGLINHPKTVCGKRIMLEECDNLNSVRYITINQKEATGWFENEFELAKAALNGKIKLHGRL